MEKRRMQIPLLVGGAAASLAHTNLRLAPEYAGPVVYVPDAEKVVEIVNDLLSGCFIRSRTQEGGEPDNSLVKNQKT
jgi:cobalamin-dependent methionine synthase I